MKERVVGLIEYGKVLIIALDSPNLDDDEKQKLKERLKRVADAVEEELAL